MTEVVVKLTLHIFCAEITSPRLSRGLPYKPLFFEDGGAVGQQQQKGEPLLVEALGKFQLALVICLFLHLVGIKDLDYF